jgi:hypothetical protein
MLSGETVVPRYAVRAASAIGATPAKSGGPIGKYLWDIDLANGALAALKAVDFEAVCTALDDICILASRPDLAPDDDWDAAIGAGISVLAKVRGE